MTKSALAIFEDFKIRRHYDEKTETWYFSLVDVIYALTQSKDAAAYWRKLKQRLKEEGNQTVTNCHALKMLSADGKMRLTDVATPEQLLRLIQSIPSPKAEPFKLWLAKVGYERIQETADPSKALDRARTHWKAQGRSQKWIQQRMMGQETRNKLTDYWQAHGVTQPDDFAMLTNVIHQEWSDLSVAQHKKLKGLEHENLREHMSEAELLFTALAECYPPVKLRKKTKLKVYKKIKQLGAKVANLPNKHVYNLKKPLEQR